MKDPSWFSPKTEVRKSSIDKKGVFAKKLIKKGEVISVLGGFIINEKEHKKFSKTIFKDIDQYSIRVADGLYLLSRRIESMKLEKEDFFNHSCNPNAGYKGHLLIIAMKDIKPGQEITYDYAMTDCDEVDFFKCCCAAKNCRKIITGDDWKKPELQKKYKGYFSWYIHEKIQKNTQVRPV